MEKPVYRISEFCQQYSISRSTFYREVGAGRICITKCGRTTLISRVAAQRWLKNLPLYGLTKKQVCCRPICETKTPQENLLILRIFQVLYPQMDIGGRHD